MYQWMESVDCWDDDGLKACMQDASLWDWVCHECSTFEQSSKACCLMG